MKERHVRVLAVGFAVFLCYADPGRKEGERKTEAKLCFFLLLSFTLLGGRFFRN